MKNQKIELTYLRSVISYDEKTGKVFWKKLTSPRIKIGNEAGSKYANGYTYLHLNNTVFMMHRIIWFYYYGEWPESEIDHINGERSDNRICNLRLVTRRQNMQNKKRNREGLPSGAWFNKEQNRWLSGFGAENKFFHLGSFDNQKDALQAYSNACINYEQNGILPKEIIRQGYTFHKKTNTWHAYISRNKKRISLGYYKTAEEAHKIYLFAMELKRTGELKDIYHKGELKMKYNESRPYKHGKKC